MLLDWRMFRVSWRAASRLMLEVVRKNHAELSNTMLERCVRWEHHVPIGVSSDRPKQGSYASILGRSNYAFWFIGLTFISRSHEPRLSDCEPALSLQDKTVLFDLNNNQTQDHQDRATTHITIPIHTCHNHEITN